MKQRIQGHLGFYLYVSLSQELFNPEYKNIIKITPGNNMSLQKQYEKILFLSASCCDLENGLASKKLEKKGSYSDNQLLQGSQTILNQLKKDQSHISIYKKTLTEIDHQLTQTPKQNKLYLKWPLAWMRVSTLFTVHSNRYKYIQ